MARLVKRDEKERGGGGAWRRPGPRGGARVATILMGCVLAAGLSGCSREGNAAEPQTFGDADAGRHFLFAHGCGSCHVIPGVSGADSMIGPPLDGLARRAYIAGRLPNEPQNLGRWIVNPQAINPDTAMPDLGVTAEQARHMAAYLYTLQ